MKPLTVKSQLVREMANLDIDSTWEELCTKSSVVKLLTTRGRDLKEQLQENIGRRVEEHYPASVHDTLVGAVPEKTRQAAVNGGDLSSDNAVPTPLASCRPVATSGEFVPKPHGSCRRIGPPIGSAVQRVYQKITFL